MTKKIEAFLDSTQKLNMGPQHPSTHGVMKLILELNGEEIKSVTPQIGFLHRGVEKLLESKTFMQGTPFFDRLDYACPMINEHVWCLSVERSLNIEVPERAKYIRVMFAELTRISSHMLWLGTHALDIGAMSVFLYSMETRENILEFYRQLSGNRMHPNYFRVGGVVKDVDKKLLKEIKQFISEESEKIEIYDKLLTHNPIWKQRTEDIGIIDAKQAVEFGYSGPMLRGSGIAWDLRKAQPYEIYEKLKFNIPVGKNGDCYSRYLVRLAEIKESFSIIKQCLEQMPKGEFLNKEVCKSEQSKETLQKDMATLINHYKFHVEGVKPKQGQFYTAVESPKGELGVLLTTNGTNKPYRCKIKSPSFTHLQSIECLAKGHSLSDLVAIIGSLDVVFGEVDR
ncbi:MAG: NADH-quinone oxidoreductase subunit D [Proteobacteria bacterium]|nr:NADH-quinone oxidoreductase subunit D [Pseudomonadota bacterium]